MTVNLSHNTWRASIINIQRSNPINFRNRLTCSDRWSNFLPMLCMNMAGLYAVMMTVTRKCIRRRPRNLTYKHTSRSKIAHTPRLIYDQQVEENLEEKKSTHWTRTLQVFSLFEHRGRIICHRHIVARRRLPAKTWNKCQFWKDTNEQETAMLNMILLRSRWVTFGGCEATGQTGT